MSEDVATADPFPGVADDELVELTSLGHVPAPTLAGLVLAPGLPEASRQRLVQLGGDGGTLEVSEDLDRIGEARLVLLSTRVPRAELASLVTRATATGTCPVVALAHTGGESSAVEVVRRGGAGVVAEGNEGAVATLLTGEPGAAGLLDSYDRHVARTDTSTTGTRGRDPVTGLPDRSALEVRLATLEQDGEVPRLACVRVVRAPAVPEELNEDAATMVRRRLATQFLHVARAHDVQVFAVGAWDFVLVAVGLSPHAAQWVGLDLDRVAETYTPVGTPLGVAMGHAGPEVTTDVAALREAAARALDAAVADRTQVVVGADALSLGMSATTELEATLRVVEHVERLAGLRPGTHARVGEVAAAIATELGYDGIARSRVQLAAHLHGVGLAALPAASVADPGSLEGERLEEWRQHPGRGADFVAVSAGHEVGDAVRAHRERWDGTGFPDGLAGPDVPVAARIVAVARVAQELLDAGLRPDDVAGALRERSGSELDPDVVAAACDLVDELAGAVLAGAR